jgi:hypothetical protein
VARIIPNTRDVRRLAMPSSAAGQAKDNPAPTVILLVAALAGIQAFRSGHLPSGQTAAALAVAAIAFVLVATVAPELVTYSLLLVLLYVGLTNQPVIEQAVGRLTSTVRLGG